MSQTQRHARSFTKRLTKRKKGQTKNTPNHQTSFFQKTQKRTDGFSFVPTHTHTLILNFILLQTFNHYPPPETEESDFDRILATQPGPRCRTFSLCCLRSSFLPFNLSSQHRTTDCEIDETRLGKLTAALSTCTALETLDLVGLGLDDAAAASVVRALPLEASATLVRLNLGENAAGVCTAQAVCERHLKPRGAVLAVLDLFANSIDDKGAATLASALKDNTTLRVLSLGRLHVTLPFQRVWLNVRERK